MPNHSLFTMQEIRTHSRPSQRTLSIRSNPGGFSFCTSTIKGEVYKELKLASDFDFPEHFVDFVQSRGWAERDNFQVTIIDFTDHFMTLPIDITDENQIKTLFDFQMKKEEDYQIFTAPLNDGKQLFCWEIPVSRDQCFEKLFPNLTILSSSYLLANWVIQQATIKNQPILVAHLFG
ncbi:MAG: DUF3822 family protein, partial [Bacteroidales bacterium]|nr:DUF3822 family protein [Bacteroidales bacterium]